MTEIVWLESSLKDLRRINQFLSSKNPGAANKALTIILANIRNISNHPEIGKPYEGDINYRELHIPFGSKGYVVHYRLDGQTAVIVRIWHAREER